jgi:hypothetical protein
MVVATKWRQKLCGADVQLHFHINLAFFTASSVVRVDDLLNPFTLAICAGFANS